jgi:hypothetical protein
MTHEELDWMPLHGVIAHVEAAVQCPRGKAIELVREAMYSLKVRSQTVCGSPGWIVSTSPDGNERFHSDGGNRTEVWREDVLREWSEHSRHQPSLVQTACKVPRRGPRPIEEGIVLSIDRLWPDGIPVGLRAKERDKSIAADLKKNGASVPDNISRPVQRALREHPRLRATPGETPKPAR